jgi:hypothetical protein
MFSEILLDRVCYLLDLANKYVPLHVSKRLHYGQNANPHWIVIVDC